MKYNLPKCVCGDDKAICLDCIEAGYERLREALQNVVNTGQSPLPSRRKAGEMTVIAIEALEAIEGSGE